MAIIAIQKIKTRNSTEDVNNSSNILLSLLFSSIVSFKCEVLNENCFVSQNVIKPDIS